MKNQKQDYLSIGFVVVLCFIGLVIVKQNWPFLSQIVPVTNLVMMANNWKTYTDTESGFSLKYPSYYFVFKGDPSLGFFLATSAPKGGNGPKFLSENDVWFGASRGEATVQSLDQYLSTQQSLYSNVQKKPVMIGGISGYKIIYTFQTFAAGDTSTTIYSSDGIVIKNGKLYTISLSSFKQDLLNNQQVLFDQMLSTFKFIGSSNSTSSNSKNYQKAITILQENKSIQYIQSVVAGNGRKAYLEKQSEKDNVVEISLIEGGFPDKHTTRIDTFQVNVETGEIKVVDMVNNKNISPDAWGAGIAQRFPVGNE